MSMQTQQEQEAISPVLQAELDEARRIIDIYQSHFEQGAYEVGEIAKRLMDAPDKYGAGAIEHLAAAVESNPRTVREWAAVTRRWGKAEFNKFVSRSVIEMKPKYSRVSMSHLVLIEREPVQREEELAEVVRNGASVAQLRAYLRAGQQEHTPPTVHDAEVPQLELQEPSGHEPATQDPQPQDPQPQDPQPQDPLVPEVDATLVGPAVPTIEASSQPVAVAVESPESPADLRPTSAHVVERPKARRSSRDGAPVASGPTMALSSLGQLLSLVRDATERLSRAGAPLLVAADDDLRAAFDLVGYGEARGQLMGLVETAVRLLDRLDDLHEPLHNKRRTSAESSDHRPQVSDIA
ncbi:MAG: hypothetical protein KKC99_13165 [Proteobacteria bacterium]|nr:hypothetical protein [Pseudomonadota bacterium]